MRAGHTLVELIAVIATASLLTALLAGTIVVQARSATVIATQAETAEAIATVTAVLSVESRDVAAEDLVATGADSLALRAHRATAVVCDTADGQTMVRWAGSRGPDPAKDSALVMRPDASLAVPVASATPIVGGTCAPRGHERIYRIDAGTGLRPGDVLLVFERGAYHLSTRALRWRVGGAGRQPLTAELFDDAATSFDAGEPAGLHIRPRHPPGQASTTAFRLRRLEAAAAW